MIKRWDSTAIFAISPLVQEAKTRTGWLASAAFYALGNLVVAALVGSVIGIAGGAIVQLLTNRETVLTVSVVVYSLVGLFALTYGMVEFGFLRIPVPGLQGQGPPFVQKLGYYPRSFVLGPAVNAGGSGC